MATDDVGWKYHLRACTCNKQAITAMVFQQFTLSLFTSTLVHYDLVCAWRPLTFPIWPTVEQERGILQSIQVCYSRDPQQTLFWLLYSPSDFLSILAVPHTKPQFGDRVCRNTKGQVVTNDHNNLESALSYVIMVVFPNSISDFIIFVVYLFATVCWHWGKLL